MNTTSRPRRIAGWVIFGLVAAVMLLAGSFGLFGTPPPEIKESMPGIYEYGRLVALVQVASALLLLIPRTWSLGLLLVTAFWGGAISVHVAKNEIEFLIPAAFLALTWIGAFLRDPIVLASFWKERTWDGSS